MQDERIAVEDLGLFVALEEHVRFTDGVVGRLEFLAVDRDVFLDVGLLRLGGSAVEQMLLRHGQHAAGAAGGVGDGEVPVRDGNLQQLDHQANDFARREVVARLLARFFREAPEQLLVDVAHFEIGEVLGSEPLLLVLVQDGREPVALHHLADDGAVVEVLDDVVNVLREAVDVGAEVVFEQRVVFLIDLAQRPVGLVRERALDGIQLQLLDQRVEFLVRDRGTCSPDLGFLVLTPFQQHALQPSDDDDRQDDGLVFVSLELPDSNGFRGW